MENFIENLIMEKINVKLKFFMKSFTQKTEFNHHKQIKNVFGEFPTFSGISIALI